MVVSAAFSLALAVTAQTVRADESHKQTDDTLAQETQTRGYWFDPTTGLMWAAKDNGKDVNWHDADKYCRKLRVAGYSDWRLASLTELKAIFDRNAAANGLYGAGSKKQVYVWHVRGDLFLTGLQEWSSTQRVDDHGVAHGLVWYFDFSRGIQFAEDGTRFSGRFANYGLRALCVRQL